MLLSDAKQCRVRFQQPYFMPSPVLSSVAFRSSFLQSLLLDLDPDCENDPDGMFSLFYNQVARKQAPKLTVIFRQMVKGG